MNAVTSLKEQWNDLKNTEPKLRIRNAAEALGVSEVELLALNCGENVIRLQPDFRAILGEIASLGKVMALTRNRDVVHERKGQYLNPTLTKSPVGLFVGEDIDLRIFFSDWDSVFAVVEGEGDKQRKSIQFFAKDGEAIHKIYLTSTSNVTAYNSLVQQYKSENQSQEQAVDKSVKAPEVELPDSEIDVLAFQESWLNLKDTHHFFGLLKKNQLTRTQALRLAPAGDYAVKVQNIAVEKLLQKAVEKQVPIMVFVGNKGMIQIHTGEVKKLMPHEGWFNVLDPDFNLHIRMAGIEQSWVVRKPSDDGLVTSLECFDEKGELIVQLFGKRKPGIPEIPVWQEIVKEVEKETAI